VAGSIESIRDITEAKRLRRRCMRPTINWSKGGGADREAAGCKSALKAEISEREKAEDELAKTNEYLENIFENSPDGIGIVDCEGTFVKWNRAARSSTGTASRN